MSKKPALVIIHSFPTNWKILNGLKEFLEDFFEVYPINLPGFIKSKPALKIVNLDEYSKHVKMEIENLGLENYWLSGVSFGFAVANNIKDEKCLGYVAIEPYVGVESLALDFFKSLFLKGMTGWLGKVIWSTSFIKSLICKFIANGHYLKTMFDEVNIDAFQKTLLLILNTNQSEILFQDKKYILIINPSDGGLNADYVVDVFCQMKSNNLVVANTTSAHYPSDISKEYFQRNMSASELEKILSAIERN